MKPPARRSGPPPKKSGLRATQARAGQPARERLLPGELPAVQVSAKRELVLVVDDLIDNRDMYVEYLRFHGYEVLAASDGPGAISLAKAHRPDVVIMDMSLPEMDGWEATRILRASPETADVRVIALTGHAGPAAKSRALAVGCDAFVTKPCLPEDLLRLVRDQLAARSLRAAGRSGSHVPTTRGKKM